MSLISELSSSLINGENCWRAFEFDIGDALIGDWLFMLKLFVKLEPGGDCGEFDRMK